MTDYKSKRDCSVHVDRSVKMLFECSPMPKAANRLKTLLGKELGPAWQATLCCLKIHIVLLSQVNHDLYCVPISLERL